jgi:hypothetical protein
MYKVVSESSWSVIVVTASVKEDVERPRPHFRMLIASVCHVTPRHKPFRFSTMLYKWLVLYIGFAGIQLVVFISAFM